MNYAQVNLWELITTVATRDLPRSTECKEIKDLCARTHSFATELTLKVRDDGAWVVHLFSHGDSTDYITLTVERSGRCTVERNTDRNDIQDSRSITF